MLQKIKEIIKNFINKIKTYHLYLIAYITFLCHFVEYENKNLLFFCYSYFLFIILVYVFLINKNIFKGIIKVVKHLFIIYITIFITLNLIFAVNVVNTLPNKKEMDILGDDYVYLHVLKEMNKHLKWAECKKLYMYKKNQYIFDIFNLGISEGYKELEYSDQIEQELKRYRVYTK